MTISSRLTSRICILCLLLGPSQLAPAGDHQVESAGIGKRIKAAQWNLARNIRPTKPCEDGFSLTTIAGASKRQLREWMRTCPAPQLCEMQGTWRGLNRGVGPALLGISQFTKQMCVCGCNGHGDNITIKQTNPECWSCPNQWQPVHRADGSLERGGRYVIKARTTSKPSEQAAELNYGEANNPKGDASRFLVDKIVKLNDQFLLGQAIYEVGLAKVTVSYFVLERSR